MIRLHRHRLNAFPPTCLSATFATTFTTQKVFFHACPKTQDEGHSNSTCASTKGPYPIWKLEFPGFPKRLRPETHAAGISDPQPQLLRPEIRGARRSGFSDQLSLPRVQTSVPSLGHSRRPVFAENRHPAGDALNDRHQQDANSQTRTPTANLPVTDNR